MHGIEVWPVSYSLIANWRVDTGPEHANEKVTSKYKLTYVLAVFGIINSTSFSWLKMCTQYFVKEVSLVHCKTLTWVVLVCYSEYIFNVTYNPGQKVGTPSKLSPPPTYNVDNRVIFSLFVGKNAIFSNID